MKKNGLWYCIKTSLVIMWLAFFSTNTEASPFQPITVRPGDCYPINLTPEHSHLSYEAHNLTCSYAFDRQPSEQETISIIGNFIEFDSAEIDQTPYTVSTKVDENNTRVTSTNEINPKNIKGTITVNRLIIDKNLPAPTSFSTLDRMCYNVENRNLFGFCNHSKQILRINCSSSTTS